MKLAVIATAAMLAFATVPAVEAATVTNPTVTQASAHVTKVAQKHKKGSTKHKAKKKKSST